MIKLYKSFKSWANNNLPYGLDKAIHLALGVVLLLVVYVLWGNVWYAMAAPVVTGALSEFADKNFNFFDLLSWVTSVPVGWLIIEFF